MLIGSAPGGAVHVMTFNLKYASDAEPNSWARRRPVMAELLRVEQPTVMGTQEGLYGQLRDIAADLPAGYEWIGVGREGGSRGEFMAVFYDTRRVTPLEFDHFWLSETPAVIGSRSWGTGSIRMVTWVRFAEFVLVNTHLDNTSEQARVRGAELLRERIGDFGLPVVLTGDFNVAAGDSAVYRMLTSGLVDTWEAADARLTSQYATFHGYKAPVLDGARIDWILTKGVHTMATGINTFGVGGQLPSDHFPVQVLVTIG